MDTLVSWRSIRFVFSVVLGMWLGLVVFVLWQVHRPCEFCRQVKEWNAAHGNPESLSNYADEEDRRAMYERWLSLTGCGCDPGRDGSTHTTRDHLHRAIFAESLKAKPVGWKTAITSELLDSLVLEGEALGW